MATYLLKQQLKYLLKYLLCKKLLLLHNSIFPRMLASENMKRVDIVHENLNHAACKRMMENRGKFIVNSCPYLYN